MADPITFLGTVAKAQTLADGGLRFTFDAGEGEFMTLARLAACKQAGAVLRITCEVVERHDELETVYGDE